MPCDALCSCSCENMADRDFGGMSGRLEVGAGNPRRARGHRLRQCVGTGRARANRSTAENPRGSAVASRRKTRLETLHVDGCGPAPSIARPMRLAAQKIQATRSRSARRASVARRTLKRLFLRAAGRERGRPTLKILSSSSSSPEPGKSGFVVSSSAKMQPTLHMSTPVEYVVAPSRSSGER